MEGLFLRVFTLSATTSLVLLPLLLLLPRLRHRYASRTCYFLWMLLALRLDDVRVGTEDYGGILVALSPTRLSDGGGYSALIGA